VAVEIVEVVQIVEAELIRVLFAVKRPSQSQSPIRVIREIRGYLLPSRCRANS
jgi:hypothetical protein